MDGCERDVSITQAPTLDTAVRANADRCRRFTQGKVMPLRGCMTQPNNFLSERQRLCCMLSLSTTEVSASKMARQSWGFTSLDKMVTSGRLGLTSLDKMKGDPLDRQTTPELPLNRQTTPELHQNYTRTM